MKAILFIGGRDVSLIGRICSKDGIRNGLTVDPCLPHAKCCVSLIAS